MEKQPRGLMCLACRAVVDRDDPRIDDREHPNFGRCPECGHKGVPADLTDRVSVSITWQELRVLCIWAERWASEHIKTEASMLKVVYGIADGLQMQHLDQKTGLTFRSELAELSAAGIKYEQNVISEG